MNDIIEMNTDWCVSCMSEHDYMCGPCERCGGNTFTKERPVINKFEGNYSFLSNFYPSPILVDDKWYATVEHAYQAAKTTNPYEKERVRKMESPGKAKRAGRHVMLRPEWEEIKIRVMKELLQMKFQDLMLRPLLLNTGDAELIEGNTWGDRFWGMCEGRGYNYLGILLMQVREEIRNAG